MTDSTKKLFVAPWIRCRIEIDGKMQPCVSARTNHTVAISFDEKDANRLARLPELYDALKEAAYEFCHNCVTMTSDSEYVPDSDDFIENNCPKKSKECFCRKWWTLLKKVRDGE